MQVVAVESALTRQGRPSNVDSRDSEFVASYRRTAYLFVYHAELLTTAGCSNMPSRATTPLGKSVSLISVIELMVFLMLLDIATIVVQIQPLQSLSSCRSVDESKDFLPAEMDKQICLAQVSWRTCTGITLVSDVPTAPERSRAYES